MTDTFIGKYRVVRKLGEGGMGVVYEAMDDSIQHRVAIKVLHAQFARDPEIAQRFFNEARAVNIVDDPGVVQISEFGRQPDGTSYLVMEYLKGESLHDRLKRAAGPMSEREVLSLTRQIASVLAGAHDKGIIHRDMKPGNVMLLPDRSEPGKVLAKVLDFGIAKVRDDCLASSQGGMQTTSGTSMGTPGYMAPEQYKDASSIDGKADVYALGVILYQMLAGRPPFDGQSYAALMLQSLTQPPRPLREVVPTLSPELAELAQAMLAKAPGERPTMRQVVETLDPLMTQRTAEPMLPTILRPVPGSASSAAPPNLGWRRLRWLIPLGGAAGIAGVTALVLVLLRSAPVSDPERSVDAGAAGGPGLHVSAELRMPLPSTPELDLSTGRVGDLRASQPLARPEKDWVDVPGPETTHKPKPPTRQTQVKRLYEQPFPKVPQHLTHPTDSK